MEDKQIIKDILFYLPDWTVKKEKQPQKENQIKPFIEDKGELDSTQYRKHISREEVLTAYNKATNQALAYINTPSQKYNPIIYEAICLWAAGILEKKYSFKTITEEDTYNYHYKSLIKEAKELLEPYQKIYFKVLNPSEKNYDEQPHQRLKINPVNARVGDKVTLQARLYNHKHRSHHNGLVKWYIE